jgi:Zn-dependent alcohol dehydrogenase
LLQAGGVSVIVGLVPSTEKVSFHPEELLFGRTWTSGLFGGFRGRTDLPLLVEKFLDGVSSKSLSDTSNQSKLKLYITICAL